MLAEWYLRMGLSKRMEYILGFLLELRVEHDKDEQNRDIDLVGKDRSGKYRTISVKYQEAAARSGNFSFEEVQINRQTGGTMLGNFRRCEAQHCVIVKPLYNGAEGPVQAYLFRVPYLHSVVPSLATDSDGNRCGRPRPNTKHTESHNTSRQHNGAENWIVPIADLEGNAWLRRFNWKDVEARPEFAVYVTQNAPPPSQETVNRQAVVALISG
jgi:hypothetical protein